MSTTVKQDTFEQILNDFEKVSDKVDTIQDVFHDEFHNKNKMVINIRLENKPYEDKRKKRVQSLIDEVRPQIAEVKYYSKFLARQTHILNVEKYSEVYEKSRDLEYFLEQIEEKMDEETTY